LVGYLFNEVLSSSYGRDSKKMQQQSGYATTFYGPGDYCLTECIDRSAGPGRPMTALQFVEGIGRVADALTLTSLVIAPPAAIAFQAVGLAADSYKFYLTRDLTQAVIDIGIPFAASRFPYTGYSLNIGSEVVTQGAKGAASDAYSARKKP
jgi:hypothetical protein